MEGRVPIFLPAFAFFSAERGRGCHGACARRGPGPRSAATRLYGTAPGPCTMCVAAAATIRDAAHQILEWRVGRG